MVVNEKFKMNILIFINILYLCAYCQCPATTKGEINAKEDKKIMDLLASILPVPIKPLQNENYEEDIEDDFNKKFVKRLGKYLLLTHNYIQRAINKHENEHQRNIVDNFIPMIVLDDYKIGTLLQYYYHRSQDIGKIFKICWFYIEINRIWDVYNSESQTNLTIKDFNIMFENKIFSDVHNLKFENNKNYESIDNPEKELNTIKDKLYELFDSKKEYVDRKVCNWFIIKNLSMKPLMESIYFYNLQMTEVDYNENKLYLKAAYNNILSNMDVYSLFNYNHICRTLVLHQFNEWLLYIFVNLGRYHDIGLTKTYKTIERFEKVSGVIRNSILNFKKFIKVYFNYDIAEKSLEFTNKMYTFIESKENDKEIERYVKEYIKEGENEIYDYSYNKLISVVYGYKARFAFYMELNRSDYIMNIEKKDSYRNNNREETLTEKKNENNNLNNIYIRSIIQMKTIRKGKSVINDFVDDLLRNLSHMNLMINVYKCLIAKQLDIHSTYFIETVNETLEVNNNIDYKPEPPILGAVLGQYLNGSEYLHGSKTSEPLPVYAQKYSVHCDAYEK